MFDFNEINLVFDYQHQHILKTCKFQGGKHMVLKLVFNFKMLKEDNQSAHIISVMDSEAS